MCNITVLPPGVMPDKQKFYNQVYNNPHGYGIILKDTKAKKMQIIRRCHKDGNDPEEIYEILENNKDIDRVCHVRWRTDGPIDMDNTHPFSVFHSQKRQVFFMHNGILHDYKPRTTATYENSVRVETNEEPGMSDSRKFAEQFLAPVLLTFDGARGKADITDPTFQMLVHKFWSSPGSKGILIANDLDYCFINRPAWKELDHGGGKFYSSNDDYFKDLVRGPKFEEEKKKREEAAAKNRANFSSVSNDRRAITNLKDVDLKPRETIDEDLSRIFEDWNIWTDEGLASLSQMQELEFQQFVSRSPEKAVDLFVHLTSYYEDLFKRKERLKNYVLKMKKGTSFEDVKVDKADAGELGVGA